MTKASALLFELAHIKVRKYAGELIDVILKWKKKIKLY
jgi:hypothetical protein